MTREELVAEREASLARQRERAAPAIARAKERAQEDTFGRWPRARKHRKRRSRQDMDWWEEVGREHDRGDASV